MNSTNSISLEDLTIGYSGKTNNKILSNLNLKASTGNLIALIGENGSGKSTLLKTILRLQNELSGKIKLFNQQLKSYSLNNLAKTISYVSTEIISVQNLSVFNLVALGRFPYTNWLGKLNKEDIEMIHNSLEQVGMQQYLNKNINEISDGERQRILIARTLAQDTPITILDEPTSFLDLPNKFEIINLLHQLTKENSKTIIFSTHDLSIALQEADLLWLIDDENIIEGAPEDLILEGQFSKIFENTKLNFNLDNGEFAIERKFKNSISLKGDGQEYYWTQKALKRYGFKIVTEVNCEINVVIRNENSKITWSIIYKNNVKEVKNILELLFFLKQSINSNKLI